MEPNGDVRCSRNDIICHLNYRLASPPHIWGRGRWRTAMPTWKRRRDMKWREKPSIEMPRAFGLDGHPGFYSSHCVPFLHSQMAVSLLSIYVSGRVLMRLWRVTCVIHHVLWHHQNLVDLCNVPKKGRRSLSREQWRTSQQRCSSRFIVRRISIIFSSLKGRRKKKSHKTKSN